MKSTGPLKCAIAGFLCTYEHNFITVGYQFCKILCNFMNQLRFITTSKRIKLELNSLRTYARTNILYYFAFQSGLCGCGFAFEHKKTIGHN